MDDLSDIFDGLADREFDYVRARAQTRTIAAACRAAGLHSDTYYRWSRARRRDLDDRAARLKVNRALAAEIELVEAVRDAARRLIDLMDSDRDYVRLHAARDILNRFLRSGPPDPDSGGPAEIIFNILPGEAADRQPNLHDDPLS
jgi:hypothetical protein